MLKIRHTGDFKGDYKRVIKQGKNKLKIANVIEAFFTISIYLTCV